MWSGSCWCGAASPLCWRWMAPSQQPEAVSALVRGRQHGTTPEREEVLFLNVGSRDTRGPSQARGSTRLPPSRLPAAAVSASRVPVPSPSHCPAASVSSSAPSVRPAAQLVVLPLRCSQRAGGAGALGVLPPPRHTQSQLTPEQGALSSSVLRPLSYIQLSAVWLAIAPILYMWELKPKEVSGLSKTTQH